MTESQNSPTDDDPYLFVIRALDDRAVVQFNSSDPSTMTTTEMQVADPWDGNRLVLRTRTEPDEYRHLKRDESGSWALYSEASDSDRSVGGWFVDHYVDVTTVELVAVEGVR